ncbi:MAG: RagB/SusD family nutrient uptake outer membrane protein [Bacteroidia bacterium]|nr:RagB/SusD family nutrient uptake outer membrane protein [Bacteroidia bacterium]
MNKNNILITFVTSLLLLGLSACNMDTPMHYYVDQDAPKATQDIENNLNGAYQQFAGYRFYGRNIPALSDIATDVSTVAPDKGHFVSIDQWSFSDTEGILDEIWKSGYVVIGTTTDVINDSKALIAEAGTPESDKTAAKNAMMQAYGLKAYTYYALVNIFGKDYTDNGATLGLIMIKDEKAGLKQQLNRGTVKEVYDYALELIAEGKKMASELGGKAVKSSFYVTLTGLNAMEAKIKLSMRDYAGAKAAATAALVGAKDISNEDYISMWASNAAAPDDIFSLKKTEDDNLSANALNTLYGSYLASLEKIVIDLVESTDIRDQLIQMNVADDRKAPHPKKFDGIPNAAAVSNIPVLRYSDMQLTLAEAEANLNNITSAVTALYKVAKRDSQYPDAASMSLTTKADVLSFIAKERIREFFAEGHRLFDLKRTGAGATINGKVNYQISKFAYPIPASEINAGFMPQQNDDWNSLLPK